MAITAEEFVSGYAERTGVTPQELAEQMGHRRWVRPCNCGEYGCEGWGMVPIDPEDGPGIPLASLV
jgi:hypothetical protein